MYSLKPVMLYVVALFNIIKGVLLMTMGNWYLMHLRGNVFNYGVSQIGASSSTVIVNIQTSLESNILKIHRKTIICIIKIKFQLLNNEPSEK